eukprot:scaffold187213_cov16-Prasinocladus_malaysianus.AAC.1
MSHRLSVACWWPRLSPTEANNDVNFSRDGNDIVEGLEASQAQMSGNAQHGRNQEVSRPRPPGSLRAYGITIAYECTSVNLVMQGCKQCIE